MTEMAANKGKALQQVAPGKFQTWLLGEPAPRISQLHSAARSSWREWTTVEIEKAWKNCSKANIELFTQAMVNEKGVIPENVVLDLEEGWWLIG